jgi:hypothetical protein
MGFIIWLGFMVSWVVVGKFMESHIEDRELLVNIAMVFSSLLSMIYYQLLEKYSH